MKCAVFFERDGILNLARVERQQQITPLTLEDFRPNPEADDLIKRLKRAGFVLLATTNQPGLSSGCQSRRELDRMHDLLRQRFPLDDILVCPHAESDRCPCRKPKPGLLIEAAFKWHLDLERSFVVSDKWHDAQAAHVAGCTSLLLKSPWNGTVHHDFILSNFKEVGDKIAELQASCVLAMNQDISLARI